MTLLKNIYWNCKCREFNAHSSKPLNTLAPCQLLLLSVSGMLFVSGDVTCMPLINKVICQSSIAFTLRMGKFLFQEVILLSKLEAEKQEERRKMCGTLQDVVIKIKKNFFLRQSQVGNEIQLDSNNYGRIKYTGELKTLTPTPWMTPWTTPWTTLLLLEEKILTYIC